MFTLDFLFTQAKTYINFYPSNYIESLENEARIES